MFVKNAPLVSHESGRHVSADGDQITTDHRKPDAAGDRHKACRVCPEALDRKGDRVRRNVPSERVTGSADPQPPAGSDREAARGKLHDRPIGRYVGEAIDRGRKAPLQFKRQASTGDDQSTGAVGSGDAREAASSERGIHIAPDCHKIVPHPGKSQTPGERKPIGDGGLEPRERESDGVWRNRLRERIRNIFGD